LFKAAYSYAVKKKSFSLHILLFYQIVSVMTFRAAQQEDEWCPPHLLAQNLNNHGAHYIESGDYERAISSLIKSFQLWEQVANDSDNNNEAACGCSNTCRCLDECILHVRQEQESPCKRASSLDLEVTDEDSRFIYRRPIYSLHTTKSSMVGGGQVPPGKLLSFTFTITFNLALAHHLSALQNQEVCQQRLEKALLLYGIAHRFQLKKRIYSPRAIMIIANNAGEIYRLEKNYSKHIACMQQLLSTMMYFFVINNCDNDTARPTELEGFFRNTSQLILHKHCADAA
jgi:tetratricopeptide (TPR) repeat protein